jgi:hypothetical protein
MISLAGGPFAPLHNGGTATGGWTTLVALVVVMAIAFAVIAVIDYRINRKGTSKPAPKREPADSDRKAA